METKQNIIDAFTLLLNDSEPAVTRANHLATVLRLLDSYANKMSDSWQAPVKAYQNAAPGAPSTGDRYAVGATAVGAWAGNSHKVATWNGSAWTFTVPPAGSMMACTDMPRNMVAMVSGAMQLLRIPQDLLYRNPGNSTTSSASLVELGDLSGWVKPGRRYKVELQLLVSSTNAAAGLQIAMIGPTCDAIALTARIPTGTNTEQMAHRGGFGAFTPAATLPESGMPVLVTITGIVSNPAAQDVITPMIAIASGTATITVLPGSTMRITDITE